MQPTKKKPGKGKRQQSSFSSPMHERKRRGNSQDGQKGTISENFSPGEEERGEEEKRGDAAQREEGEGWRRDGNSIFERKQWMIFNQRREGESRERRAGGKARSVCGSENMGFSEEEEEEEEESSSLIRRYSNIRGHLIPPPSPPFSVSLGRSFFFFFVQIGGKNFCDAKKFLLWLLLPLLTSSSLL